MAGFAISSLITRKRPSWVIRSLLPEFSEQWKRRFYIKTPPRWIFIERTSVIIIAQLGMNTTMKKLHIYSNLYRIYRTCHLSPDLHPLLSCNSDRALHHKPEPDSVYNRLTSLFNLSACWFIWLIIYFGLWITIEPPWIVVAGSAVSSVPSWLS